MLSDALKGVGAVVLEGPKACGKTETARQQAASEVRLDVDRADRLAAETAPELVLNKPAPMLIDEWQIVPSLWNHVRRQVDDRGRPGQFILTGSATPNDDARRHSGAGRFAVIQMRTMSMTECGKSDATVSLRQLLDGGFQQTSGKEFSITEIAEIISVGGWPGWIGAPTEAVLRGMRDYLRQISHVDVPLVAGRRRNPEKVMAVLRSIARNTATEAAMTTLAADTQEHGASVDRDTARDYIAALQHLWILEPQPAWSPSMRSRVHLRSAPKWHLADTSLAVAALRASPAKLLQDFETLGLLFESLVVHELRVLSAPLDGVVYHYRDNKGLEVDAIVDCQEGRWGAFEVKLGSARLDAAAENLLSLATKIDTTTMGKPSVLGIITSDGPAYRRADGVLVIPVGSFGP